MARNADRVLLPRHGASLDCTWRRRIAL